jgi:hypothetical protein
MPDLRRRAELMPEAALLDHDQRRDHHPEETPMKTIMDQLKAVISGIRSPDPVVCLAAAILLCSVALIADRGRVRLGPLKGGLRMHIVLVAALALATSTVRAETIGQRLEDQARQNCEAEWPGDYAMQRYCLEQQAKAAGKFADMVEQTLGAHVKPVAEACLEEWPGKVASYNWVLVAHCVRRQLEAYDNLHR